MLLNLVSCHEFTEKPNSIVILNCRSRLVNKYLAKWLFIIEKESQKLSILLNEVKLTIHAIDQLETYFVVAKITAISSVSNTIKKLHIHSDLNSIYKQNFYNYKQKEIDELYDKYHIPLINDLDHPAYIEECK